MEAASKNFKNNGCLAMAASTKGLFYIFAGNIKDVHWTQSDFMC